MSLPSKLVAITHKPHGVPIAMHESVVITGCFGSWLVVSSWEQLRFSCGCITRWKTAPHQVECRPEPAAAFNRYFMLMSINTITSVIHFRHQ